MLCLFLDMSFDVGAIALFQDGSPFVSVRRNVLEMKSPLYDIQTLLESQSLSLDSIDFFAVATGPGSYTGLRNAASIIKTMAYTTRKPIIEVSSLLTQVPAFFSQHEKCAVIFDAKVGGFYVQLFEKNPHEKNSVVLSEPMLISPSVTLLSDAVQGVDSIYSSLSIEQAQAKDSLALIPEWMRSKWLHISELKQSDRGVTDLFIARFVFDRFHDREWKDWDTLSLKYLRKTQAEIEWETKLSIKD